MKVLSVCPVTTKRPLNAYGALPDADVAPSFSKIASYVCDSTVPGWNLRSSGFSVDDRTFEGDDWGWSMEACWLSSPGALGRIKVDVFGGHCSYRL